MKTYETRESKTTLPQHSTEAKAKRKHTFEIRSVASKFGISERTAKNLIDVRNELDAACAAKDLQKAAILSRLCNILERSNDGEQ